MISLWSSLQRRGALALGPLATAAAARWATTSSAALRAAQPSPLERDEARGGEGRGNRTESSVWLSTAVGPGQGALSCRTPHFPLQGARDTFHAKDLTYELVAPRQQPVSFEVRRAGRENFRTPIRVFRWPLRSVELRSTKTGLA